MINSFRLKIKYYVYNYGFKILRPLYKIFMFIRYYIVCILFISYKKRSKYFPKYFSDNLIIYISPKEIKLMTTINRNLYFRKRFIFSGNWDLEQSSFLTTHKTVKQLFVERLHYTDTEEYIQMKKNIQLHLMPDMDHVCFSDKDIDDYFDNLIKTYNNIKDFGYKSQAELKIKGDDEVTIYIGRNGEFIRVGAGYHRTEIARILDIDTIPVKIAGVHSLWVLNEKNKTDTKRLSKIIKSGLSKLDKSQGN